MCEMQKNTPQNVKFDLNKYYPSINDEIKDYRGKDVCYY